MIITNTKKNPIDYQDFEDKIDCIVRNIEDNIYCGKIKGGTIEDLGEEFKEQYKKLRPYKKGWHLPIPMKRLTKMKIKYKDYKKRCIEKKTTPLNYYYWKKKIKQKGEKE